MAEYFSTMASGIGGTNVQCLDESEFINHSSLKSMSSMMDGSNNSFRFRPVNWHELKEAIDKMDPRKAAGYDGLQPKVLKLLADELSPSLTAIFNLSVQQGEWVTRWKRGEWIPVFKNEDRQEVRNYRPITVLPALGKIYEQLLSKQASEYIDPILSHTLTAYRKNNGCESTILRLVENWKKDLDCKKVVGVLSSDMSKAFDSLWSPLLMKKLEACQFSEEALKLVRSYFSQEEKQGKIGIRDKSMV